MWCKCGDHIAVDQGKQKAVLAFLREELLYDIRNYAYVEGHLIIPKNTEDHRPHVIQDIGEEGNVDRVTRVLDLAHARVVEMLYPFTKKEYTEYLAPLDDVFIESPEYIVAMQVPEGFSHTTLQYLERLIHEYFVAHVLWDWLMIANPEAAASWRVKLDNIESSIKSAKAIRVKKVRRGQSPF